MPMVIPGSQHVLFNTSQDFSLEIYLRIIKCWLLQILRQIWCLQITNPGQQLHLRSVPNGFSRSVSEAMDTFYNPYFHFCCKLALDTWVMGFSMNVLGVHDFNWTHSLVSLQWSGFSDQQTLLLTENCLQYQKWSPCKGRVVVSTPVCAKRREMAQPVPAMCTACDEYACQLPPIPPFFASTILIFKMDYTNW